MVLFIGCLHVIWILIVPHAYNLLCDIVFRIYYVLNAVLTQVEQNYYRRFANCNGLSVEDLDSLHLGMF